MWNDPAKELAVYYGAADTADQEHPHRRTKVLDAHGDLILEYNDHVIAGAHPEEVLEDLTALFGHRSE